MSHVVESKIAVNDLDALAEAAQKIGLEFVANQKTHQYYAGQSNPCEHLVRFPNAKKGTYEVGIVKNSDGDYVLAHDEYPDSRTNNAELNKALGHGCRNLIATYIDTIAYKAHPNSHVEGQWQDGKYRVNITIGGGHSAESASEGFGYTEARSW